MHAAAAGDEAAFHELLDRRAPGMLRVAFALCGNRTEAEDLCQEAWLAAYRSRGNYTGQGSVKGWLNRILVRRAGRHWKRRDRQRAVLSLDRPGPFGEPSGASARRLSDAKDGTDPASPMAAVDQRLDLLEAIRSLPEEFRDTVLLREVEGLSYQEIADTLGIPRGTVESRLYRARQMLRQKLTGY